MKELWPVPALLLAAAPAWAQRDFSAVEMEITHVGGSVYALEGAGGVIGASIGPDGIVLVDDQFAPLAPKIRAALASVSRAPIRYVLNTHWHGDHTGGNELFGAAAPILAHHNVRERLARGSSLPAREIPPAPPGALPVITFAEGVSVHLNGEEVRAIHFPSAHTDGDAVVYFPKSKVAHLGDLLFNRRFPYVDHDSGGSVRGLIAAVRELLAELPPDVKLIAGHGPLGTRADLEAYGAMLEGVVAAVERGVAQEKSLERMKREKALARFEGWSWGFVPTEEFLETVYREVSGAKPGK